MNIYIGNLNYRVRESDLQQVLEEYGTVESVKLIIDRDTRRSKGFAFAELPNENEARNAIEVLYGAKNKKNKKKKKKTTPKHKKKIASKYTNGDMDKILYPRSSFIPF